MIGIMAKPCESNGIQAICGTNFVLWCIGGRRVELYPRFCPFQGLHLPAALIRVRSVLIST